MWADWPLPKSAGLAHRRSSLLRCPPAQSRRRPRRALARAPAVGALSAARRSASVRAAVRPSLACARPSLWQVRCVPVGGRPKAPCLRLSQASGGLLPALVGRRGKAILGGRPLPRASAPRVPRALVGRPTGRQGGRPPPAPGARLPVAVPPRFAPPPCAGGYMQSEGPQEWRDVQQPGDVDRSGAI